MRRDTLEQAIERVVNDLKRSGFSVMFQEGMQRGSSGTGSDDSAASWISLAHFQQYSIWIATYGEAERTVLDLIGLSRLSDASFWQSLLRKTDMSLVWESQNQIRFAVDYLPKFAALLKRGYPSNDSLESDQMPSEFQGKGIIRIILAEDVDHYSSSERLIKALQAIQGIYDVVAELDGVEGSALLVLGIDSGSDKLFDLLGLADAINQAKEIILGLYDRVTFKGQLTAVKNISAIAESLPVFSRIASMEVDGSISPQQAELLRRKINGSLETFLECGAMIPEMERPVTPDPRLIMRPQQKLLSAPMDMASQSDEARPGEGEPSSENLSKADELKELSPSDAEQLKALLARAGFKKSPARTVRRKPKPKAKKPI